MQIKTSFCILFKKERSVESMINILPCILFYRNVLLPKPLTRWHLVHFIYCFALLNYAITKFEPNILFIFVINKVCFVILFATFMYAYYKILLTFYFAILKCVQPMWAVVKSLVCHIFYLKKMKIWQTCVHLLWDLMYNCLLKVCSY